MKFKSLYSLIVLATLFTVSLSVSAQPARRRNQQTQQQTRTQTRTQTKRAGGATYREFPAAQVMPSDADWRRDVYRELDLMKDENAPLYYPIVPQNGRSSLFTYLFKLVLRGQVKAYRYNMQGTEDFSAGNTERSLDILQRFEIPYDTAGGRMRINDVDIPSEEVTSYFVKESTYYDQHTATFHSRIVALCPVLHRGDDFGGSSKRPMFWVKYEEAAPYFGKLMILYSNLNNAAQMSADDYFTQNLYKGDIYMATNLQDRLLVSADDEFLESDSSLQAQRNVIEQQITDFEQHVWRGDSTAQPEPKTTTVVAASAPQVEETAEVVEEKPATVQAPTRQATVRRNVNTRRQRTARPAKTTKSRSGGGSSYSVRRQRH